MSVETNPESGERRSPLHEEHVALGARLVPFAGWSMPVQYEGVLPEHRAVRERVGLFDISHMGQLMVQGENGYAGAWLNRVLTNQVGKLGVGQGQYTFLLNEAGGVIDDLILYRLHEDGFLLVVNAARIDEDRRHLEAHLPGDGSVRLEDLSDAFAGMALQGPRSAELMASLIGENTPLPSRNEVLRLSGGDGEVSEPLLCRTGYTGEDGFELFCPVSQSREWWRRLLSEGEALGVQACGLGARDTLRLEMGYPLNGSDLDYQHSPIEAGLKFFVDLEKEAFVGGDVLREQVSSGVEVLLAGIVKEAGGPPPRPGYTLFAEGGQEPLGTLTSGSLSPSLGAGIGLAYLPREYAKPGQGLELDVRGRRFPVSVAKKPFYKPGG